MISDSIDNQLDSAYSESNLTIISTSCSHFDEYDKKCKQCKFYSKHETCEWWPTSFGVELRDYLIKQLGQGIRVNKRLIDLWSSRKFKPQGVPARPGLKFNPASAKHQSSLLVVDVTNKK